MKTLSKKTCLCVRGLTKTFVELFTLFPNITNFRDCHTCGHQYLMLSPLALITCFWVDKMIIKFWITRMPWILEECLVYALCVPSVCLEFEASKRDVLISVHINLHQAIIWCSRLIWKSANFPKIPKVPQSLEFLFSHDLTCWSNFFRSCRRWTNQSLGCVGGRSFAAPILQPSQNDHQSLFRQRLPTNSVRVARQVKDRLKNCDNSKNENRSFLLRRVIKLPQPFSFLWSPKLTIVWLAKLQMLPRDFLVFECKGGQNRRDFRFWTVEIFVTILGGAFCNPLDVSQLTNSQGSWTMSNWA